MTTLRTKPDTLRDRSLYALLLDHTDELQRVIEKLNDSLAAESRDSQDLREEIAVKDEVLGLVAHELRGPLTTILGNASILLKKGDRLEASTVESALQDIEDDGKRLQKLLANLLVLASPKHMHRLPDEPLDFYPLVQKTIYEHRKRCPERQIHLSAEEKRLLVPAHPDYTEEVLVNLLGNAEKYSRSSEPIEVRLRRAGDHIEVAVLDRGPGVAEHEADAIFQPFYRSPYTAAQAFGHGLGLAVCKRLVEIQGGRIWVAPREGGGSEFAFALPVSRATAGAPSD